MTYAEAERYIASLEPRGWRLGLDRMRAFCEEARLLDALGVSGGPQFVHVAGTNGKGSTTAYLQSLMVESGVRTGAFFSPYVVDPRERVQFQRDLIPKANMAALTERLRRTVEQLEGTAWDGVTEFEFKTALGFAFWKEMQCEWVALEVGLGGRFDATNVVTPRASAIVSIGMDHMAILGDTLGAIAFEKAGIIKPRLPVVVGNVPPEAAEVIDRVAAENESPIWRWGADFRWEAGTDGTGVVHTPTRTYSGVRPGMAGAPQGHNLSLAVAAMEVAGFELTEDVVQRGAALAYVPGRFQRREWRGTPFILDGAHNPDSACVLAKTLRDAYPGERFVVVTNMVRGHATDVFYREIGFLMDEIHVVPIRFHRAYSPEETAISLREMGHVGTAHEQLGEGLEAAMSAGRKVLVTGSFYLVGEVLRFMDENE